VVLPHDILYIFLGALRNSFNSSIVEIMLKLIKRLIYGSIDGTDSSNEIKHYQYSTIIPPPKIATNSDIVPWVRPKPTPLTSEDIKTIIESKLDERAIKERRRA